MADAKKEEPTKPTPEEKLAAAEAEVDALVKKGLKALPSLRLPLEVLLDSLGVAK